MPFMTRPVDLTSAIHRGLIVLCYVSAPLTATSYPLRDMGASGATYSFRIGMDNHDQVPGDPFTSSSAVQDATLSRISGNGNSSSDALKITGHLAINLDAKDQLLGYTHSTHTADVHTTVPGTPGSTQAEQSTRGGTDGYARDIGNNHWWAVFFWRNHRKDISNFWRLSAVVERGGRLLTRQHSF